MTDDIVYTVVFTIYPEVAVSDIGMLQALYRRPLELTIDEAK